YKKARSAELRNITGITSVYEAPETAEINLHGEQIVTTYVKHLLDPSKPNDNIRSLEPTGSPCPVRQSNRNNYA
uniref:adenylyl-sulfate kinase n=1 Tax=Escherichia coli TaxID=562 RepID=UPI000DEE64B1